MQEKYKNKDWLIEQYVKNKLRLKDISEMLQVKRQIIKYWLNIFEIKNGLERSSKGSKYWQLNDRDWLYNKYFLEKLSTTKISKLISGCCPMSVKDAINKFGWKTRNKQQANILNTENKIIINQEFIDGSLLGDGGMFSNNKNKITVYPYFYKTNIHKSHLEWFANHIIPKEEIKIKETSGKTTYKGITKIHKKFSIVSCCSEKLLPFYKRWYPKENNYKKLVPRDIIITPNLVLNWFLDDGCSIFQKNTKEINKNVDIILCTQSFTKEDNEFLIEKLNGVGLKSKLSKAMDGTGFMIKICYGYTNKFLEYIGKCPIKEFEYKWKFVDVNYKFKKCIE